MDHRANEFAGPSQPPQEADPPADVPLGSPPGRDNTPRSTPPDPFGPLRRRRRRTALTIVTCCAAAAILAQALAPQLDNQWMNVVGYLAGLVAFLTGIIWSLRRPGLPITRRLAPLAVVMLLLAGFVVCFRLEGFTGELEPIFRFRFATKAELPDDTAGRADRLQLNDTAYPGFLGEDRNGVLPQRSFAIDWQTGPPQPRWRQPIGAGWSGFAIADGFGITLEQREEEEWISCYDLTDGRLVWHHAEAGRHATALGGIGPRSTPTIWDGKVYAQTALGQLVCLQGTDGQLLWRVDLLARGALDQAAAESAVAWGRAGSPLIVDDLVVVPFGGRADPSDPDRGIGSLIAFDATSGDERWVGGDTQISYASPVLTALDGRRQIVSANESNVSGHDPATGEMLWQIDWPGASNGGATCSNPIPYQDDGILLGKGYGGGGMLLRVNDDPASDRQLVTVDWENSRVLKTKFTNAVIDGSFAYALSDGYLECVDLTDGSRRWRQSRSSRYGQGQLLRVDDILLVQAEMGDVVLVDCQPDEFVELARIEALQDKTWNYPAVAGTTLLIRNHHEAIAYDLPPRTDSEASQP